MQGVYCLNDAVANEASISALFGPPSAATAAAESGPAAAVGAGGAGPLWVADEAARMRKGLMAAVQNVVLLRDPEDDSAFYPRFGAEATSSFAELDDWSRGVLREAAKDHFFGRQADLWRSNALRTLSVLMDASRMLICGEDLGLIPDCVPPVLASLGLVGLRIQRMPHPNEPPTGPPAEFGSPASYPYMTVCAPSCHDTTTTRCWYNEDPARRKRYFEFLSAGGLPPPPPPATSGPARPPQAAAQSAGPEQDADGAAISRAVEELSAALPADAPPALTEAVARAVIGQHLASPSVLAVFPLQDLMALSQRYCGRPAEEESINNPTVAKHYWRWRSHVPLEDLLLDASWIADLRSLVERFKRNC